MTHTLTMFNTGQITLPKVWRSQFVWVKNFIAEEKDGGLFIRPLLPQQTDISYYESNDGVWLYSDQGINPDDILLALNRLHAHG